MKSRRFFLGAHPAQAVLEALLLGHVVFYLLSLQAASVSQAVLSNGLVFLCGASGMWAVFRVRIPRGTLVRQIASELASGTGLSVALFAGIRVTGRLLGWESIWLASSLGNESIMTLLLLGTGPGYLVARVGLRVLHLWNELRRQRMLWAITHALLTVVVLVIFFGAGGLLLLSLYSGTTGFLPVESSGILPSITERVLHTIFPGLSAVFVMTLLALIALLPPAALISYLIARGTTRRLETLASAARALTEGNYDVRVKVTGKDEVAQLQSDFNAMAADLQRSLSELREERDRGSDLLESRRAMVATVSHELRTPVATARATLESALSRWSETLPPGLSHDLEVMDREIARLQHLIDDLFTLARADAGGLNLECRPTDAAAAMQRLADAQAPLAWRSGRVEITSELPDDLPLVWADQTRLEQVLSNLLRNAVQHTPPGGIVAVTAHSEQSAVCIQVNDTGQGIAEEDLPHIWERFYQGPSSDQSRVGGAGLGLALVKELVEAMGGAVSVQSSPGRGSHFTIRLPQA